MKGNDGNEYISKPDKNLIYKWKKIKQIDKTKTPYEYYSQFSEPKIKFDTEKFITKWTLATTELSKQNIILLEIGWKKIGIFIDFAWETANEYLYKNQPCLYF